MRTHPKKTLQEPALWHLYLIECRSGAYYAGITNNLEARYQAHASGNGARYTRANPPVRLLGAVAFPDRSSALRAEWAIKQLPRREKLAFLTDAGGITFPSAECSPSLADGQAVRLSSAGSI